MSASRPPPAPRRFTSRSGRRGDLNATSGFFINMLVNVLVLTGLSIGVVQIPADQVTSILLPALGLQLLFGNFFYFYLARKLALQDRAARTSPRCPTGRACRPCSS